VTGDEFTNAVARIDVTTADQNDSLDAKRQLAVMAEDNEFLKAVDWALTYFTRDAVGRERFGPLHTFDNREVPPPPNEAPTAVMEAWERLADAANSAVVRARLNELCFVIDRGDRREHARAASDAYLEMARRPLPDPTSGIERISAAMDVLDCVRQAVRLATYVGLDQLAEEAVTLAVQLASEALETTEIGPGWLLGLLRCVVGHPACPAEVDDLLVKARDRYADDVFNTASTIELQIERAQSSDTVRGDLHREHIQGLLDAAETSAPLVAMMHIRDAIDVAERNGLTDLRDEAIRRLQELGQGDLGLTGRRVEFTWPREAVDGWLEETVGNDNWHEAMIRLLTNGPPTGNIEENRAMAAQMPSIAPLATAFPSTILDRRGMPIATVAGDDPEHLLIQTEKRRVAILAPFLQMALERIVERYGPIDHGDAADFFGMQPWVGEATAKAIGRTFNRLLARDYEAAAFTGVPRIERVLRDYLIWRGESIWRPPERRVAPYPGLGAMLSRLTRLGVDESWVRFLDTFFCERSGFNFRNDLAHGEVDDPAEFEAVLTSLALAYVCIGLPAPAPR
jgi:hypothetical protein